MAGNIAGKLAVGDAVAGDAAESGVVGNAATGNTAAMTHGGGHGGKNVWLGK